MTQSEITVCSLCECGNACYELSRVLFHVVKNQYEERHALVECGRSPVHVDQMIRTPRFSSGR